MDINAAIAALGALAQETRLATFRLLIRSGSSGLPAGEIAKSLDIPHNTMSTHLNILCQSGLIGSRRAGRSVIYSVDFAGTRTLLRYLLEDCCLASPDTCSPVIDSVLTSCCSTNIPEDST
jgi:ArsR family transcriptional regulator